MGATSWEFVGCRRCGLDPQPIVMVAIDITLASILMDSGLRRNDGKVPTLAYEPLNSNVSYQIKAITDSLE